MRSSLFLSLVLGFGVLLGACDGGDDDHHGACSHEEEARIDTVLALDVDETAGAGVFANTCGNAACHGSDGNSGPAVDLGEHIPEHGADELACIVLAGSGDMPSQSGLTDQELADVLAYVQATF